MRRVSSRSPNCPTDDVTTTPRAVGTSLRERQFNAEGPIVADVGEQRLLAILQEESRRYLGAPGELIVGTGDDAAVWQQPSGAAIVWSQDATVEGVDYQRRWITPYVVGRRAIAAALSDLAGMGATPCLCLVTYCLPASTKVDDVRALQAGIVDLGHDHGCHIVGGDVSAIADVLVVDVSVMGTMHAHQVMKRENGRAGDLILATGVLGRAAAGLKLLIENAELRMEPARQWVHAQQHAQARIDEGMRAARAGVRCAGDISDGLYPEVMRTATASNTGAEIWLDRIPVDEELTQQFPQVWQSLALAGGEDFELLLTAPSQVADVMMREWPDDLAPLHVIGRLTVQPGVRVVDHAGGTELPVPESPWAHFRYP